MSNQGKATETATKKSQRRKRYEQLVEWTSILDQPIRDFIDKQLSGIWPASINKFTKRTSHRTNYQYHKDSSSMNISEMEDQLIAALDKKNSMKWVRKTVVRELYLQGFSISEIARKMKLSRYTIARDLGTYQGAKNDKNKEV